MMMTMNFNDLDDEKIEDIECAQSALSKFYFGGYVFLHKFVHVKCKSKFYFGVLDFPHKFVQVKCMSKFYFDVHVFLHKFVHVKCMSKLYFDVHALLHKFVHVKCIWVHVRAREFLETVKLLLASLQPNLD